MPDLHECEWGPVESARFTGNAHRKCVVPDCRRVSLDLDDAEVVDESEDVRLPLRKKRRRA